MSSTYPATSYADGVDLTITSGNQLHEVINGGATTEVTTESGMVPSVRKAIADSLLFKPTIAWDEGSAETDPLQPRSYNGQIHTLSTLELGRRRTCRSLSDRTA